MTAKRASDTPITDAVLDTDLGTGTVGATYLFQELAKHARIMERDRARLIKELVTIESTYLVDFNRIRTLLRELGEGEAT